MQADAAVEILVGRLVGRLQVVGRTVGARLKGGPGRTPVVRVTVASAVTVVVSGIVSVAVASMTSVCTTDSVWVTVTGFVCFLVADT